MVTAARTNIRLQVFIRWSSISILNSLWHLRYYMDTFGHQIFGPKSTCQGHLKSPILQYEMPNGILSITEQFIENSFGDIRHLIQETFQSTCYSHKIVSTLLVCLWRIWASCYHFVSPWRQAVHKRQEGREKHTQTQGADLEYKLLGSCCFSSSYSPSWLISGLCISEAQKCLVFLMVCSFISWP